MSAAAMTPAERSPLTDAWRAKVDAIVADWPPLTDEVLDRVSVLLWPTPLPARTEAGAA